MGTWQQFNDIHHPHRKVDQAILEIVGPRLFGTPGAGETPLPASSTKPQFMPKGNISELTTEEVRRVNSYLVQHASCPRCGSRDVLWYQYNRKSLDSGSTVYMRCQGCGNDEYTEL